MIFSHGGNVGDVIWALPSIRDWPGRTEPASLLLRPNLPAQYQPGIVHPCGKVRMNRDFAEKLLPLLNAQPYLAGCGVWEAGRPVDVDLDKFRETGFAFDRGHIGRYYGYAFRVSPDLARPWLTVDPLPDFAGAVVVNRTSRYHNHRLSYAFLSGRGVVFLGLREEFKAFAERVKGAVHVEAPDFLTLARWLAGISLKPGGLFIGNQSFCYALAEGLGVPRILETCGYVPNVIPGTPNGWEAWNQNLFQETFEALKAR